MHISFLDFLIDPHTGEALNVEIRVGEGDYVIEGFLKSSSHTFPIVRGIPRFAGYSDSTNYTDSFSYQWDKWSRIQFERENAHGPMRGHTLTMWEKITALPMADLKGQVVADFGCGAGRFIDIARTKGAKVIGIDLSFAVDVAYGNFKGDADVLICQADVLHPPIKPLSVDGAYSIGVFHHTPDPKKGFSEMVKCLKRGGWAAVAVYEKGGYYDFPTVRLYRAIFKALWPLLWHYPPLVYSYVCAYALRPLSYIPVLGHLVRALFPFVRLPDAKWSLLDTFDSVTPAHQSAHTSFEVYQWFKENGLTGIEPSDWGSTAWHGMRGEGKEADRSPDEYPRVLGRDIHGAMLDT